MGEQAPPHPVLGGPFGSVRFNKAKPPNLETRFTNVFPNPVNAIKTVVTIATLRRIGRIKLRPSDDSDRQTRNFVVCERSISVSELLVSDLLPGPVVPPAVSRIHNLVAQIFVILVTARQDDRIGSFILTPRRFLPLWVCVVPPN